MKPVKPIRFKNPIGSGDVPGIPLRWPDFPKKPICNDPIGGV